MEQVEVRPRNIPPHVQLATATTAHPAEHTRHVQGSHGILVGCHTASARPERASPHAAAQQRKRRERAPASEAAATRLHGYSEEDVAGRYSRNGSVLWPRLEPPKYAEMLEDFRFVQ